MIAALALATVAAPVPAAFADVPNVRIVTYPVRGADAAAIHAALVAAGPIDPHDGSHVEAGTDWHIGWRWPGTPGGDDCDLAAASVTFRATVTLPRLVGIAALSPEVQADWRRYRAAIEQHESNHARYAYGHRGAVLNAIRGATCATADAAGQAAIAWIVQHDLDYDRDTSHGATEGAVFP